MTTPDMNIMMTTMYSILIMNLMTKKTSIMCMNLMLYTMMMSMTMSMKMKSTPIPFIVFLTIIGGLMIIFLYMAATLWMKKENMTMMNKMMIMSMLTLPLMTPMKFTNTMLSDNYINIFSNNFNKITMMLIILLTLMLMFMIEIHMKMNSPFRRKLKIWE